MNLLIPGQFIPTLDVFRSARSSYDCTRNGISVRFSEVRVVYVHNEYLGESHESVADSLIKAVAQGAKTQDNDCIFVRRAPCNGHRADVLVPVTAFLARQWTMMGGNFAHSCDSRWSELQGFYGAIPIHDRIET